MKQDLRNNEMGTYEDVRGFRYLVAVDLVFLGLFSLSKSSNCSRAARISDIAPNVDKKGVRLVRYDSRMFVEERAQAQKHIPLIRNDRFSIASRQEGGCAVYGDYHERVIRNDGPG
jgi:hypothetical protein